MKPVSECIINAKLILALAHWHIVYTFATTNIQVERAFWSFYSISLAYQNSTNDRNEPYHK